MYQVFINGYGIIGSRLATALTKDKSINLIGIAKYSVDEKTQEAINKGYKVFVPRKLMKDFQNKKYDISGSIEDAINQSDWLSMLPQRVTELKIRENIIILLRRRQSFKGGKIGMAEILWQTLSTIQE